MSQKKKKVEGTGGCHSSGDIAMSDLQLAGVVALITAIAAFGIGVLVGVSMMR